VTIIVAAVGDLHVGSTVGLCPRRVELDDGGAYEASKSQRWLWTNWEDYWRQVAALKGEGTQVVALLNGDICDRNKHSGYQLVTLNRAVLLRMAVDTLDPVLAVADHVVIVRGTEAHVGGSAELEEELASDIKAVPDEQAGTASWWCWEATLDGYKILAQHHPGTNSTRPWTQGGGANRLAAMVMHAYYGQRWAPDLVITNHVHHNEDSSDNHACRAVFNRPFSLRTAFDHRSGRGYQTPEVGGLIAQIERGRLVDLAKPCYPLPRRRPWRMA
jgi:hypothetical protein